MKVSWYLGGLHFEPEHKIDRARLSQLAKEWGALDPSKEPRGSSGYASASSSEELFDLIVGSQKGSDKPLA
jgi:hypothetical protein